MRPWWATCRMRGPKPARRASPDSVLVWEVAHHWNDQGCLSWCLRSHLELHQQGVVRQPCVGREAQLIPSCGPLVEGQASGLRAQDGIFWHLGRGL